MGTPKKPAPDAPESEWVEYQVKRLEDALIAAKLPAEGLQVKRKQLGSGRKDWYFYHKLIPHGANSVPAIIQILTKRDTRTGNEADENDKKTSVVGENVGRNKTTDQTKGTHTKPTATKPVAVSSKKRRRGSSAHKDKEDDDSDKMDVDEKHDDSALRADKDSKETEAEVEEPEPKHARSTRGAMSRARSASKAKMAAPSAKQTAAHRGDKAPVEEGGAADSQEVPALAGEQQQKNAKIAEEHAAQVTIEDAKTTSSNDEIKTSAVAEAPAIAETKPSGTKADAAAEDKPVSKNRPSRSLAGRSSARCRGKIEESKDKEMPAADEDRARKADEDSTPAVIAHAVVEPAAEAADEHTGAHAGATAISEAFCQKPAAGVKGKLRSSRSKAPTRGKKHGKVAIEENKEAEHQEAQVDVQRHAPDVPAEDPNGDDSPKPVAVDKSTLEESLNAEAVETEPEPPVRVDLQPVPAASPPVESTAVACPAGHETPTSTVSGSAAPERLPAQAVETAQSQPAPLETAVLKPVSETERAPATDPASATPVNATVESTVELAEAPTTGSGDTGDASLPAIVQEPAIATSDPWASLEPL